MKKMMAYQKEFDKQHGWNWSESKDGQEKLRFLQYGVIAITGEIGELANNLKKMMREHSSLGKLPESEDYEKMREEIIDSWHYLINLSMAAGMNADDVFVIFLQKHLKNRKRSLNQ